MTDDPPATAPGPRGCPICARPMLPRWRPFCSNRCAQVDLQRWLGAGYMIEGSADEETADD